ncbi:radical SAM/SPASM domain-containing protein [Rhodovulum sulfidophilum]|uniref:radical SAM/SPASM domain-containing protein n=1 Tax=Rhodovulum sulfidophilum TaxID=35806 RepID=UPI001389F56F|nr:radical SAM protein [Rhodovulum sulfidophilum]NDK37054.1 radical SAM protein [Rhodovulum sulfidophilum]
MSYSGDLHTLHFNVTNTCNLACSFCYIDAVKAKTIEIPIDRVRSLAEEARELGCKRVIVSGGELFARKDWFSICLAFDKFGIEVSLVTNGTLIGEKEAKLLAKLENLSILISIDGSASTHDQIRGKIGAYEKSVEGIELCKRYGLPTQVNATIIKKNFEDVVHLAELSLKYDILVRFSLLNPYNGRGPNLAPDALDVAEILQLRAFCSELRTKGSRVFINLPPLLLPAEDVIPIRSPACGWTESYCGITHDGNVTICGVAGADKSLHQGNVMEQPLGNIWKNSPLFNQLRSYDTSDLKGVCARCKLSEICGGACRLSAYKSSQDFKASYGMCQTFYDMGLIPEEALKPEDGRRVGEPIPAE